MAAAAAAAAAGSGAGTWVDALGPARWQLWRPGGMVQLRLSRRPHPGRGRRREDWDELCGTRGRRSPCPGQRPGAGHGWGARGGTAAITAHPLPPGPSVLLFVAAWSLSSPLGSGARPLPGGLLATSFRGGNSLGTVLRSVSHMEASARAFARSLRFVIFRSVFGCYFCCFSPFCSCPVSRSCLIRRAVLHLVLVKASAAWSLLFDETLIDS